MHTYSSRLQVKPEALHVVLVDTLRTRKIELIMVSRLGMVLHRQPRSNASTTGKALVALYLPDLVHPRVPSTAPNVLRFRFEGKI